MRIEEQAGLVLRQCFLLGLGLRLQRLLDAGAQSVQRLAGLLLVLQRLPEQLCVGGDAFQPIQGPLAAGADDEQQQQAEQVGAPQMAPCKDL